VEPLVYGQPPPGLDIRLSIDLDLQKRADTLLANHAGAVVLLNAESGEFWQSSPTQPSTQTSWISRPPPCLRIRNRPCWTVPPETYPLGPRCKPGSYRLIFNQAFSAFGFLQRA